jgi:hypothetical protein
MVSPMACRDVAPVPLGPGRVRRADAGARWKHFARGDLSNGIEPWGDHFCDPTGPRSASLSIFARVSVSLSGAAVGRPTREERIVTG